MKSHLADAAATAVLAQRLQSVLPADVSGWSMLLEGELGAGKSSFARALITAMGHSGAVPSPTYTLVEPYQVSAGTVYHIDLYRVSSEEELRYLGWGELEDGFRLVEWPDRSASLAASADLGLRLSYADAGRISELNGFSDRGRDLLSRLKAISDTQSPD